MPKNLRNFYIHCNVDGLQKPLASGPKSHTGGMSIDLMAAINGQSVSVLKVDCIAKATGKLVINIDIKDYPKTIVLEYHRGD